MRKVAVCLGVLSLLLTGCGSNLGVGPISTSTALPPTDVLLATATSAPPVPALAICLDTDFDKTAFACTKKVTEIPDAHQSAYDIVFTKAQGTFNTDTLTWELSTVDYKGDLTRQFAVTSKVAKDDVAEKQAFGFLSINGTGMIDLFPNHYQVTVYANTEPQGTLRFTIK